MPLARKIEGNRSHVPIHVVESLPSGFLPYPEGTRVAYQSFTFGDLEFFSNSTLDDQAATKRIMEGIEVEKIDVEDLSISDFLYIALMRKLSSIGDGTYIASVPCPSCGGVVEKEMSLTELDFMELKENVPKLPVTVTLENGDEVRLGILTLRHSLFIKSLPEEDRKKEEVLLATLFLDKDFEEAKKFVLGLSYNDHQRIKYVDSLLNHGLKPVEFQCPSKLCKHPFTFKLEVKRAFFRPAGSFFDSVQQSLQFG